MGYGSSRTLFERPQNPAYKWSSERDVRLLDLGPSFTIDLVAQIEQKKKIEPHGGFRRRSVRLYRKHCPTYLHRRTIAHA